MSSAPSRGGELPRRAVERLLDAAAPLLDEPERLGIDGGRYELGEELGRGGMGVVYAAWDRELGRKVALKVLFGAAGVSGEARGRFVREARAAARLVHPHIAAVYDATGDVIAMQRVEGRTLAEAPIRDPRALAAHVRDAALAIHYAHGEGVVHRDLKPANLMVTEGERPHVFVMDFGLAKELRVDASLSLSGGAVGTPGYMAPEQARGEPGAVGPPTDVYGLGATLYACLAGEAPFEGDDVYRLVRRVIEEEPPPLRERARGVDADLATIVGKCLEKDPARRYPTALALAGDLDRWLRGEPVQARPPSALYRLRRFASRRQGAILASSAAAAVVVLAVLPFLVSARASRRAAEERRDVVERVLELAQRVTGALDDARAARFAGLGHEELAPGILEEAAQECLAFLERADVGRVRHLLGRVRREQGRYEEAVAAFDGAERVSAAEIPGLRLERGLALGALYRRGAGAFDDPPPELGGWRRRGAEDLAAGLAAEPDVRTADRSHAAGCLAWLRGDLAGAIAHLREAVEMDPTHQQAHYTLSRVYLVAGRDDLGMRHSVIATDLYRGFRRTYLARGGRAAPVSTPRPGRELLALEGMRELLVDFNLLLDADPGDANAYALRAQSAARRALREAERGETVEAVRHLEEAIADLDRSLEIRPESAPALVDRGALLARLARLVAAESPARAAELSERALADYTAAIEEDTTLAVARFDRALLHLHRSVLARLALAPDRARSERARAAEDAAAALALLDPSHPWRSRFEELVRELAGT